MQDSAASMSCGCEKFGKCSKPKKRYFSYAYITYAFNFYIYYVVRKSWLLKSFVIINVVFEKNYLL